MRILPAIVAAAGFLASTGTASARCESLLRGVDGYSGDQLVAVYKKVLACDTKVANQSFPQFMRAAGDADTLVALSLTAIEADVWNPVWEMIGKISSYEARDEVAERIGLTCTTSPKVTGFLQGAYYGLRDIEFAQWDDALISCSEPTFHDWLVGIVEDPPPRVYDEKWSSVAQALVRRAGRESLAHLTAAAIKAAANGGPFDAILLLMEEAVAPDLGEEMDPADREALEAALVEVAKELKPDQARAVADRLANSGSEDRAAALLPNVYPDRQSGGYWWYGAVAVEAGECSGEKQAILHLTLVGEPGRRWIILDDVEEPLRAAKPRLTKCTTETPWLVLVSPEPLPNRSDATTWLADISREWEAKGYEVKIREEKDIRLP